MRLKVFICLALAIITFGLYWPTRHFPYIYRDDLFFLMNPEVATGLSSQALAWMLKAVVAQNWHPVTILSFLVMRQLFGLNPGAEHLLNAGIHAANAALLFLVLLEMTQARWRSAIVAAIFAWHPLRVESVAWIAERKDVLFTSFMLFSLLCYTRYTRAGPRKPSTPRKPSPPDKQTILGIQPRTLFYSLALFFFALSLLSKAMSVTLPFLLLLLDLWPLKRVSRKTVRPLLAEKAPFFALTILFSVVTFWIQKSQGAVTSLDKIGYAPRLENVISSYVSYLGMFFWPSNLVPVYPFPQSFDSVHVALCGLLLVAVSALCILQLSHRPYLAVGWFWFLGSLVPVIGLVQLSAQAMADRYTYVSLIGPAISLVWLVSEIVQTNVLSKRLASAAAVVILGTLPVLTESQLNLWRDTITLFEYTTSVTGENSAAEYTLALAFDHAGLSRQAAVHYRIAASVYPDHDHYYANYEFSKLLAKMGHYREAEERMELTLKLSPDSAEAINNLALLLTTCPDEKVRDRQRAVQLAERACELTHGESPEYLTTLSGAYEGVGRFDDAIATVQKAGALAQQTGQVELFNTDARLLQLYMDQQQRNAGNSK